MNIVFDYLRFYTIAVGLPSGPTTVVFAPSLDSAFHTARRQFGSAPLICLRSSRERPTNN